MLLNPGENGCDLFTFTFSHFADTYIQSDLQMRNS